MKNNSVEGNRETTDGRLGGLGSYLNVKYRTTI